MTNKDRREFIAYLVNCTDSQVEAVYWKEKTAGRQAYADLAMAEARARLLDPNQPGRQ